MKTDIEIVREADIQPISDIAEKIGISDNYLEPYGKHKAKINLNINEDETIAGQPEGKLILVTAMTPTPAGEGKTTLNLGKLFLRSCLIIIMTIWFVWKLVR
ncbi:formate--tetrahydrofolate ligase [Gammaproteobacteria bacterium]|nr:formate--tetrahydrofolate ligase [Gammaproteobacteria bacterium]